jgi:cell surface protein SprA
VSNTAALSTTNLSVQETESSEIVLRATYRKRGLDIPFLPIGRLNNQISFTLTVSRAVNDERSFSIRRALTDAADSGFNYDPARATEGDNVSIQVQTTRLTVAPKLSYQFSNRVSADFVLEYENFTGDSRKPSYTEINGGFNVRVSISEN